MNHIISLLLLCVLIGTVLSDNSIRNRMARAMMTMRNLKAYKERQRRLQNTNEIEVSDSDAGNAEEKNTTSPPFDINEDEPSSQTPKETNEGRSALQIKKFYNYKRLRPQKKIGFNLFLYFLNRIVLKSFNIRLKLVYYKGLRSLENDAPAESVPAECNIREDYKDKVGTNVTGENIDYNCSAPTSYELEIDQAILDTNFNLEADNESINFTEINFDPTAANEANNLILIKNFTKSGSLDDAQVELPVQRNFFRIKGNLNPEDLLSQGDVIPIEFVEYSEDGEEIKKNINCSAIKVEAPKCTLECDTSKQTINTVVGNLSLATSQHSSIFMKINGDKAQKDEAIVTPANTGRNIFRKNSSGLSGGAIAAIVIACVIALIAASVAAIMFRKQSPPPMDNSTTIGLKTIEN